MKRSNIAATVVTTKVACRRQNVHAGAEDFPSRPNFFFPDRTFSFPTELFANHAGEFSDMSGKSLDQLENVLNVW
jgi:hypothetical protein